MLKRLCYLCKVAVQIKNSLLPSSEKAFVFWHTLPEHWSVPLAEITSPLYEIGSDGLTRKFRQELLLRYIDEHLPHLTARSVLAKRLAELSTVEYFEDCVKSELESYLDWVDTSASPHQSRLMYIQSFCNYSKFENFQLELHLLRTDVELRRHFVVGDWQVYLQQKNTYDTYRSERVHALYTAMVQSNYSGV